MPTSIHPRHASTRMTREHNAIAKRYAPSAREIFAQLRPVLLASRPIIGDKRPIRGADGVKSPLRPIYGKPTFRNRVVDGQIR